MDKHPVGHDDVRRAQSGGIQQPFGHTHAWQDKAHQHTQDDDGEQIVQL